METELYNLRIEFITPVLGTKPQRDVATEYLAGKSENTTAGLPDDEMETLPELLERGTTAFHKLDGRPILYDYMPKAFLKETGRIFNGLRGVKNLRSKVENYVFVKPRRIPLIMPDGAVIEYLERPLRAETAQGPRTSLARSEMLPEGTYFECQLEVFESQITKELLADLLSYGKYRGLLQWRSGGYGRFTFTIE
jgi:hypothetical protein